MSRRVTVVGLKIGRRAPPIHALPGEPKGEVVCECADADPVVRRDGGNDALQPLYGIAGRLNASLSEGLSLTVEHDLTGKLTGGDLLI